MKRNWKNLINLTFIFENGFVLFLSFRIFFFSGKSQRNNKQTYLETVSSISQRGFNFYLILLLIRIFSKKKIFLFWIYRAINIIKRWIVLFMQKNIINNKQTLNRSSIKFEILFLSYEIYKRILPSVTQFNFNFTFHIFVSFNDQNKKWIVGLRLFILDDWILATAFHHNAIETEFQIKSNMHG